jgi:hypothetical protein
MNQIRRICLYGGPGIGKSHTAAELYSALGKHSIFCELIYEIVKEDAYNQRPIFGAYQMRRFGEQAAVEENRLFGGVPLVVTDSPLDLQCYYARSRNESFWRGLKIQADWMEERFPSLNIFLSREGIPFNPRGRFQTYEQTLEVDINMKNYLVEHNVPFEILPTVDFNRLLNYVLEKVR